MHKLFWQKPIATKLPYPACPSSTHRQVPQCDSLDVVMSPIGNALSSSTTHGLPVACGPSRHPLPLTAGGKFLSRPARTRKQGANASLVAQAPKPNTEKEAFAELVALSSKQATNRPQKVKSPSNISLKANASTVQLSVSDAYTVLAYLPGI